jgi:uncharacterized membrane protein YbhN (UPF0104 family)
MRGELHPSRDHDEPDPAAEADAGYDLTPVSADRHGADLPALGPAGLVTRRNMIFGALFILAALVGLYFLLPKLAGLNQTWGQLKHGDPLWLAVGAGLEILSVAGYTLLFRTVFARGMPRLGWRASVEIPLAGIAAIRLLAAAGAGGVAVTVWALRRAGMSPRVIACRIAAIYSLQYSVYLGALVVCGIGLWAGFFAGAGPVALTLLPGVLGAGALALGAGMGLAARIATLPATLGSGVRTALGLVRERRVGLIGALAYWGFDIAVLGVSFHAFGSVVPVAVVVMGYFLGTLGSLLPLPGGVGGVEGGMIGAFAAFGVPAGRAVVAVLAYRAISFWLPTLPGIGGYLSLRSTVRAWRLTDTGQHEALREG